LPARNGHPLCAASISSSSGGVASRAFVPLLVEVLAGPHGGELAADRAEGIGRVGAGLAQPQTGSRAVGHRLRAVEADDLAPLTGMLGTKGAEVATLHPTGGGRQGGDLLQKRMDVIW
jgi:hypothetical protein